VTAPDAAALAEVARVLAEAAGLSFSGGLSPALEEGIARAASALSLERDELVRRVRAREPAAVTALVEGAVVGETSFWRQPEGLAALVRRLAPAPRRLSLWSAGCASGEEAYSLAIALLEAGRAGRGDRVVATDVSARALARAAEARYGPRALRRLAPEVVERWFEPGEPRRVKPAVRELVSLVKGNLVADPPPPGAPFDAVVCRNVLIYFEPATAAEAIYRLVAALRPGGLLVLSPVELPLAAAVPVEWIEDAGATLLRRPDRE
jgi:chemotaxis protein methyltransferase CheR